MTDEFETGTVIEIEGDLAIVEMPENEHCHHCGARMVCRAGDSGKRLLKLKNTLNTKPGDRILIEQSEKSQLQLVFMQYGFPLLAFITGIIISGLFIKQMLWGIPREVWQFIGALFFMLLAGLGTRNWANKKALTDFSVFRMHEICE